MAGDPHDNEADDRAMLRKLTDQETIMNNDDERDYEEEAYNAHLLDDETDPDEDDYTRVIVLRVPVRAGLGVTRDQALADINRIIIRAWKRLAPMSDLAGPVTVIPDEPPAADLPDSRAITRDTHRDDALRLADMAERSDPEFVPGLGFAAITQAVLALSAPASPDPEPDWLLRARDATTWQQRAKEAEAALTTIGGICARSSLDNPPDPPGQVLARIEHVLRTSGREADRLMTQDHRISSRFRPGELDILIISAAEMWQHADPGEASEYLSARQTIVLAEAARQMSEYLGEEDPVTHTGMRAHDGLVPHSHEVRPDHKGVRRDLT